MAVSCKSIEQIALEALEKVNTTYESPKEKQLAFIIGIPKLEKVFVCLWTGFGKTIITASLPHAFNIAADAKSSYLVVLFPLTRHHEVLCQVTFNGIYLHLIYIWGF